MTIEEKIMEILAKAEPRHADFSRRNANSYGTGIEFGRILVCRELLEFIKTL